MFRPTGQLRTIRYRDDDWPATQGEAKAILAETAERGSRDRLLSQTMDRAIGLLLEYNEVYPG